MRPETAGKSRTRRKIKAMRARQRLETIPQSRSKTRPTPAMERATVAEGRTDLLFFYILIGASELKRIIDLLKAKAIFQIVKKKLLHPCQIITLRDYPLYNEHILRIYFRIFVKNQGQILPPCPVIHKSLGIPYVNGRDTKSVRYNKLLRKFLEEHPRAEYFLIDGSHKTTAATLSHRRVPAVVIEHDGDFKEAKRLIRSGEFFGWYSVENSIKEAIGVLAKHHFGAKEFLTAEDKAGKMVKDSLVPGYMISYFKKNR
jgi:hypothetical protein